MTSRYDRIKDVLQAVFHPVEFEIIDESHKHAGHAGRMDAPAGGETHFKLMVVSDAFAGQSRLVRSRAVHEALKSEFESGLHALSLSLRTPAEAEVNGLNV